MDFVTSHFGNMKLLYSAITPKSEDKYVVKVFNWSEVHLSEMTCYKIHTLVVSYFFIYTFMKYFLNFYITTAEVGKGVVGSSPTS